MIGMLAVCCFWITILKLLQFYTMPYLLYKNNKVIILLKVLMKKHSSFHLSQHIESCLSLHFFYNRGNENNINVFFKCTHQNSILLYMDYCREKGQERDAPTRQLGFTRNQPWMQPSPGSWLYLQRVTFLKGGFIMY